VSGFWLEDVELKSAPAQVTANGGRVPGNRDFAVSGGRILAPRKANNPFAKWQRRALASLPFSAHLCVMLPDERTTPKQLAIFSADDS
jgi:hypothetical protein